MRRGPGRHRLHDAWWTLILFAVIGVAVLVTAVSFTGSLRSTVPVTLTADRSGLVMDSGAKVMMRGVQVGRVAQIGRIEWAQNGASLRLEIDPDQIRYIPANVEAQISATTAFGAKFVDLVMPQNPSRARLSAGAVLHSKNVSTEINTVFENVVDLLNMIDPLKLNAVLTAVADAVRGQGERIGQATTDLNEVLEALNARGDTIGGNWRSLKNFTDTYDAAAQDILTILNAASTTSAATVVNHSTQLDALLLNAIGLSNAGTNLLGSSRDNLVGAADILAPTTSLLFKYNPEYTCFLQGAKWYLDNGGYAAWGGADGRTLQLDVALLFGNDPYVYPDNLPVVAAKGGPGGRPGIFQRLLVGVVTGQADVDVVGRVGHLNLARLAGIGAFQLLAVGLGRGRGHTRTTEQNDSRDQHEDLDAHVEIPPGVVCSTAGRRREIGLPRYLSRRQT